MNQTETLINEVQEALRGGQLSSNPHQCALYRSMLSGEYSYLVGLVETIKARKPVIWLEMRKNNKSDTATEKEYSATTDGIQEKQIEANIKRVEKLMTGLNSLIRLAEGEAVNQF